MLNILPGVKTHIMEFGADDVFREFTKYIHWKAVCLGLDIIC